MQKLTLSIIQTPLFWEDKEKNYTLLNKAFSGIKEGVNLIVLPEMFNTGFTMQSELFAEEMEGPTMQWMFTKAQEKNAAVCGSIIIKEKNHYYNRLIFMMPSGNYEYYDKRHLFRMGNEHQHFSPGNSQKIVNYLNWKFNLQICYDLRFPIWSYNRFFDKGYDVLIYVANWPERRNKAWKSLLMARAIENQCYVIGVNRIGTDGHSTNHTGDSAVINYLGDIIHACKPNTPEVVTCILDKEPLEKFRIDFPVGLDADDFEIKGI
jgi:predicted amidohydrolase